jgi:purine/pyrimidine-nucleoside phosphorylase
MPTTAIENIEQATVKLKANIYFDGKVISHTVTTLDGARKTIGVIYAGSYKFNTDGPERMDIIAGSCRVRQAPEKEWKTYAAGTMFQVLGKSSFEIAVDSGLAEYLCTFE